MISEVIEQRIETFPGPLELRGGGILPGYQLACEWYGEPNRDRSNVILLQHGATASAHAAGYARAGDERSLGWWDRAIGPGCLLDTRRFAVLSVNALGSCYGSTGPTSVDPGTGRPYGSAFPVVTPEDVVRSQVPLLERFEIPRFAAVVGGSMGGILAMHWAVLHPDRVERVVSFGAGSKTTAMTIGFNEALRHAIYADPNWNGGDYEIGHGPVQGLQTARMIAVMTWMSADAFAARFGRRLQDREAPTYSLDADFQIESFLRYYGTSSTENLDANTYIRMMRLLDYHDLSDGAGREALIRRLRGNPCRFLLVGFSTDMRCPPAEVKRFAEAIAEAGGSVDFLEEETSLGHSSFVMEPERYVDRVHRFLH